MRFRKLASGRNPQWALWDRFDAPDYDTNGIYLTRWRIVSTPLFGVYLHRFTGPDPRPTLHDHPWNFLSVVLRGGYIERRRNPVTLEVDEQHQIRRVNAVNACDAHSIRELTRTPTWTLLLVGRRRREWGYWEPRLPLDRGDAFSYWYWTGFDRHVHAQEFEQAMERRRRRTP